MRMIPALSVLALVLSGCWIGDTIGPIELSRNWDGDVVSPDCPEVRSNTFQQEVSSTSMPAVRWSIRPPDDTTRVIALADTVPPIPIEGTGDWSFRTELGGEYEWTPLAPLPGNTTLLLEVITCDGQFSRTWTYDTWSPPKPLEPIDPDDLLGGVFVMQPLVEGSFLSPTIETLEGSYADLFIQFAPLGVAGAPLLQFEIDETGEWFAIAAVGLPDAAEQQDLCRPTATTPVDFANPDVKLEFEWDLLLEERTSGPLEVQLLSSARPQALRNVAMAVWLPLESGSALCAEGACVPCDAPGGCLEIVSDGGRAQKRTNVPALVERSRADIDADPACTH
jgi:hypothetical protein